jgi:hypothetical protein
MAIAAIVVCFSQAVSSGDVAPATRHVLPDEAFMSEAQSPLDAATGPADFPDPPAPPPARSGHERLVTLSGALLVVIAIPVYLYWSAAHDKGTTAQIEKELTAEGVQVFHSANAPSDSSLLPFESSSSTVRIQATSGNITDTLLPRIRDINQDLTLILNNCPVTDEGFANLQGKKNVRWLELRKTKITNESIKYLRGMDLEALDISITTIDDAGLASLGELSFPNLQTLSIEKLKNVTDDGISHLSGFKKLEFVSIAGTKVTRTGIDRLRDKLPNVIILGGP